VKERKTQIELSKAWNKSFVKQLKMSYGSIDYVEHTQVTQKLIALIPDVQMKLESHIYDKVEDENGVRRKFLTGVVYTISGTIDGEFRTVTEAGMCDKPFFAEGNRKVSNNGERLKECISDAIKRCAMRLGVGIELYDTQSWLSSFLSGSKTVPKKAEEKAPRKQKGAMAYDGANKERSESADRVIEKTKKTSDGLENGKKKLDKLVEEISEKKKIDS